jgi:probable F420-dependent oxidoreductase
VKLDSVAFIPDPVAARDNASEARARGFDGWFTAEVGYDPFVACAVAADAAGGDLDIGTAIAVAFGRTPMTVSYAGNDLQGLTGGRFILGLGSQIKPHIERRYSMPWSKPAARMREFIAALRAIWHAWEHEEKLDFRGDFYEHTLMTPFFAGTNHGFGPPDIAMAAVGPLMTQCVASPPTCSWRTRSRRPTTCGTRACHGCTPAPRRWGATRPRSAWR